MAILNNFSMRFLWNSYGISENPNPFDIIFEESHDLSKFGVPQKAALPSLVSGFLAQLEFSGGSLIQMELPKRNIE